MIKDITHSDIKQKRDRYLLFKNIDYLKVRVFENRRTNGFIKTYLQDSIQFIDKNERVYEIDDFAITECLLNESFINFDKALYNWSIYKRLVNKGLWSWAYVTLYYSQFYTITGLLNIQGIALPHTILLDDHNCPHETQFHLYPKDFANGIFFAETRRLNKPHKDYWSQYYKIYKRCKYKVSEYYLLYQYDIDNEFDFVKRRNLINYDITNILIEYLLDNEELNEFCGKMSQNIFEIDLTEDEYLQQEYISSLRIKLFYNILNDIAKDNILETDFDRHNDLRIKMLNNTLDDTYVSANFKEWINS